MSNKTPMPSKYQKGEERHILRSQIKEAPYNPRVIGEGAEKRLRKNIKKIGLLGTLIWNERSGNLVSGHQRLKQLDAIEGYPVKVADYEVRVTAVDLSDKEEREANVFLNNPSAQGEWELDKLAGLIIDDGIEYTDMGFTDTDMSVLFGGDPRFDALFQDTEEVTASKEQIREVREHRATSTEKMKDEQSADFYFVVVCQSQQAKIDLLKGIGVPASEEFVNGALVARKLGVVMSEN